MGAAEQKVEPLTIYDGSLNGTPGMWSLPVVLNYGYFDTGLTTQNQSVSIRNTEAETFEIGIGDNVINFSPTDLERVIYLDPFSGRDKYVQIISQDSHDIIVKVEYVATKGS